MGRIPDLPCDIEQVVELLGIEVIRDTRDSTALQVSILCRSEGSYECQDPR